jgi:hypothetical protein
MDSLLKLFDVIGCMNSGTPTSYAVAIPHEQWSQHLDLDLDNFLVLGFEPSAFKM